MDQKVICTEVGSISHSCAGLNERQHKTVRNSCFWSPKDFEDHAVDDDTAFRPLTEDGEDDEDMDKDFHDFPKHHYAKCGFFLKHYLSKLIAITHAFIA